MDQRPQQMPTLYFGVFQRFLSPSSFFTFSVPKRKESVQQENLVTPPLTPSTPRTFSSIFSRKKRSGSSPRSDKGRTLERKKSPQFVADRENVFPRISFTHLSGFVGYFHHGSLGTRYESGRYPSIERLS